MTLVKQRQLDTQITNYVRSRCKSQVNAREDLSRLIWCIQPRSLVTECIAQPSSIDRKEAIQLFLTQRNLKQVQKFSSNINLWKEKEKETTPYQAYFKTNHDMISNTFFKFWNLLLCGNIAWKYQHWHPSNRKSNLDRFLLQEDV